ncbi:SIR2 family NAD-dependent protein deacylase [Anaerobium acetethylicum]|uniref:protein acetyllysine N-acetyltransferase n=1 Tax=Anaerobium acetethylicum TaxID=1619234 RepID=A0A1D3TVG9_9FIRM|nr:Sir2 family NAD-dependent protein deacetylase [Anaerobium acetethylicum]SCP98107.1 NAD-dependent deacetylase [Anaerobium acetethylicum]
MSLTEIRKIINDSDNIVCLCGLGMNSECGFPDHRVPGEAYDIELKYGHSPEDLFSSLFYTVRTKQFFQYYKNEILCLDREPGAAFYSLAELEKTGKLRATITRSFYSLPQRAGCKKVIELLGSIYKNTCPHCGTEYTVDFVKSASSVPLCPECQKTIRPGVCLYGEMVDNQLTTKSAETISKADVLLVLGTNLKSRLCEQRLKYFNGSKVILINEEEHYSDDLADYVIHDKVNDVLPYLVS